MESRLSMVDYHILGGFSGPIAGYP